MIGYTEPPCFILKKRFGEEEVVFSPYLRRRCRVPSTKPYEHCDRVGRLLSETSTDSQKDSQLKGMRSLDRNIREL